MKNANLLIALFLPALSIAQPDVEWHPAAEQDLAPAPETLRMLKKAPPVTANNHREPVQFSWKLEPTAQLEPPATAIRTESRSYWLDASGKALSAGLRLPLTSEGAVIRISPVGTKAGVIEPAGLTIEANGRILGQQAAQQLVGAEALKAAGLPVADGSLAFRLADGIDTDIRLRIPDLAKSADQRYVVHVFEPRSQVVLKLETPSPEAVLGDTVHFKVELGGVAEALAVSDLSGYLSSPDGQQVQELRFAADKSGSVEIEAETLGLNGKPGLWELHVFAEKAVGQQTLLRDGRTVVSLAAATARFAGDASLSKARGSDALTIAVDVAAAGRYEAGGILYGEQAGVWVPVAVLTSAAWLEPGAGEISLAIEESLIGDFDSFELRQLALRDQSRLATLWRQSLGLSFELSRGLDPR